MKFREILVSILGICLLQTAQAAPTSVTIAGSLQSELGCAGDWDPACANAHLAYDAGDDVWQGSWTIPAGGYEYKAALNNSWTANYGLNAVAGGANIPLSLGAPTSVKFYYDDKSHWVTDNVNSRIVVAPGSFQSELGCPGDWDPSCLRSWLEDPDGDGIFTYSTTALPAGSYEAKAAINESWIENYGQGGVPNGANIPFSVLANNDLVTFSFNSLSNTLMVVTSVNPPPPPEPGNIGWANLQWPPSMNYTVGPNPTDNIYGQVWIDGITSKNGATPGLLAWVGFGTGLDPSAWSIWESASFNVDAGNNDEFVGVLNPQYGGTYYYAYRYKYLGGDDLYVYGDLNGPHTANLVNPGILTVIGPPQPPNGAPEPGTLALLGLGLAGLAASRRHKH